MLLFLVVSAPADPASFIGGCRYPPRCWNRCLTWSTGSISTVLTYSLRTPLALQRSYPLLKVCSINDSPDALDRMLAVMRFALTKDLKFIVMRHHLSLCIPSSLGLEAWQDLQTVQLCSGRAFPNSLGHPSCRVSCAPRSSTTRSNAYH